MSYCCLAGALSVEDGINFSGGLFSSKWCAAESFGGHVCGGLQQGFQCK